MFAYVIDAFMRLYNEWVGPHWDALKRGGINSMHLFVFHP